MVVVEVLGARSVVLSVGLVSLPLESVPVVHDPSNATSRAQMRKDLDPQRRMVRIVVGPRTCAEWGKPCFGPVGLGMKIQFEEGLGAMTENAVGSASGTRGRYRRWLGLGLATMLLLALVPAAAASGADGEPDIVVSVDTVIHAPVGSTTVLASITTPAAFVGATCTVSATTENQSSVHPNNDLVIDSATSVVIPDVEAVPGGTVTATDDIVLSGTIVVSLLMGPDHTFSAGVEVSFDCTVIGSTSTTSTTVDDTTTTTVDGTTTSIADTTTTADVGGTQVTSTTVEVLGTVVTTAGGAEVGGAGALPFTGVDAGQLALVGMALLLLGALVLLGGREAAPADEG